MKRLICSIGIFCVFCTLLLYSKDVYTTSILLLRTNDFFVLSWMANVEEGEFVVFGGEKPLASPEILGVAKEIWKGVLRGSKKKNLYVYEKRLEQLDFPYVCVLPVKSNYLVTDIFPWLNANMVAFPFSFVKEVEKSSPSFEEVIHIRGQGDFEVRGSILGDRVILAWFFDDFEGREFLIYRLSLIPTEFFLRQSSPVGRVRTTAYEDFPPVGGPYYYVVVHDGQIVLSGKNVFGPVWFPVSPSAPRVKTEE